MGGMEKPPFNPPTVKMSKAADLKQEKNDGFLPTARGGKKMEGVAEGELLDSRREGGRSIYFFFNFRSTLPERCPGAKGSGTF